MEFFKVVFRSKRNRVAIAAIITIVCTAIFGEGVVDPDTINNLVLIASAWIVGETFRRT